MSAGETKAPPRPSSTENSNEACGDPVLNSSVCQTDENCPADFKIEAPCRIVKIDGGKIQIKATDLPGYLGGSFEWSTNSTKIKLSSTSGSVITVEGLTTVGSGKDSEVIKVTRKNEGCDPIQKEVKITVAKLSFAPSSNQKFGFDDNDTPLVDADNHICIKQLDDTVVEVKIKGGAVGTDFEFTCDDAQLCVPDAPQASAKFDLKLVASNETKKSTVLNVKAIGDTSTVFCKLNVHVYKERAVGVIVAKIDHKKKKFLTFPTADYAAHATTANAKLKEAVVKYNIRNFDTKNGITHVKYKSKTGVLNFDINSNGGKDLKNIQKAFKGRGVGKKVRVAIIHDMKSFYYLSKAAKVGDTQVTVKGSNVFFKVGEQPPIGNGTGQESLNITGISGNKITCAPLVIDHAVGEGIEFPAAGWSTDPILIMEGSASLNVAKWTILHEVGHRAEGLTLKDIDDVTNFMHYMQSWTDYRLRYCPRTLRYSTGAENQWDKIPRT